MENRLTLKGKDHTGHVCALKIPKGSIQRKPNSVFDSVRFLGALLMKIPMQLAGKDFVRKIWWIFLCGNMPMWYIFQAISQIIKKKYIFPFWKMFQKNKMVQKESACFAWNLILSFICILSVKMWWNFQHRERSFKQKEEQSLQRVLNCYCH